MTSIFELNTRISRLSPESIARILSAIAKIDELKGQWIAGAKLHPQILGNLKQSVLITSTGASTRIEGARLSDEDIEKLMRGISIQKFRDRDVLCVDVLPYIHFSPIGNGENPEVFALMFPAIEDVP